MASEDSDQIVPGLLAIHRLCDLRDLNESFRAQMPTSRNQLEAAYEFLKVTLLCGAHRVPTKERNDRFVQLRSALHQVVAQMLPMIVVPSIDEDPSYAEELLELLEAGDALLALRHDKSMRNLIAGSIAFSLRTA